MLVWEMLFKPDVIEITVEGNSPLNNPLVNVGDFINSTERFVYHNIHAYAQMNIIHVDTHTQTHAHTHTDTRTHTHTRTQTHRHTHTHTHTRAHRHTHTQTHTHTHTHTSFLPFHTASLTPLLRATTPTTFPLTRPREPFLLMAHWTHRSNWCTTSQ